MCDDVPTDGRVVAVGVNLVAVELDELDRRGGRAREQVPTRELEAGQEAANQLVERLPDMLEVSAPFLRVRRPAKQQPEQGDDVGARRTPRPRPQAAG